MNIYNTYNFKKVFKLYKRRHEKDKLAAVNFIKKYINRYFRKQRSFNYLYSEYYIIIRTIKIDIRKYAKDFLFIVFSIIITFSLNLFLNTHSFSGIFGFLLGFASVVTLLILFAGYQNAFSLLDKPISNIFKNYVLPFEKEILTNKLKDDYNFDVNMYSKDNKGENI